VLRQLIDTEPWRLPSFAIRVPLPRVDFAELAERASSFFISAVIFVGVSAAIIGLVALLLPFLLLVVLMFVFIGLPYAPFEGNICGQIFAVVFGKAATLMIFYYFVNWTCPGTLVFKDDGSLFGPGEGENCATCLWTIITWGNCSFQSSPGQVNCNPIRKEWAKDSTNYCSRHLVKPDARVKYTDQKWPGCRRVTHSL
jgi:hypothetical protein